MRIEATPLPGLLLLMPQPIHDERGFFCRSWSVPDLAATGVDFVPLQSSLSFSQQAGTLRGLHWQEEPHGETKLVRVTQGAVYDVAVDLRPGSPTLRRWFGVELTAQNRTAMLIPKGFAHGLITLQDETEVVYVMDAPYVAPAARGARHDDPAFGIAWPRPPLVIGDRDRSWPDWNGCP